MHTGGGADESAPAEATRGAERTAPDRRRFLAGAGAGVAVAWAAPNILSVPAAAAATVFPARLFIATGGDGDAQTYTSSDGGATWPTNATPVSPGDVHSVAYS